MAITLAAIAAAVASLIGGGISALIAVGTIIGNVVGAILIFPFEAFKGQPFLILMYYWCILFVDSFLIGGGTGILFNIIGLEGWSLTFTGISILLIPNMLALLIWGWVFEAYHLLFLYSVFIIMIYAAWLAILKMKLIRR